jgi:adenylylsulfate kinase-like enzyme
VHVSTPLAVCRARDTEGVYRRAELGELGDFPGVSAPYEAPDDADLVIDTSTESVEASVDRLVALLEQRGSRA